MKYLRLGILGTFFTAILTALQGCSPEDVTKALLVLLALMLPGLGGTGEAPVDNNIFTVSGQLNLPNGVNLDLSSLQAVSLLQSNPISSSGAFQVQGVNTPNQLMVIQTQSGNAVLFGYVFNFTGSAQLLTSRSGNQVLQASSENGTVTFNARTTALTMCLLTPFLFGSSPEDKALFAQNVLNHPDFNQLVLLIETALQANPETALDPTANPQIYQLASTIALDVFNDLEDLIVPDSMPLEPSQIIVLPPPPGGILGEWIDNRPGPREFVLLNKTFAFYAVELTPINPSTEIDCQGLLDGILLRRFFTLWLIPSSDSEKDCGIDPSAPFEATFTVDDGKAWVFNGIQLLVFIIDLVAGFGKIDALNPLTLKLMDDIIIEANAAQIDSAVAAVLGAAADDETAVVTALFNLIFTNSVVGEFLVEKALLLLQRSFGFSLENLASLLNFAGPVKLVTTVLGSVEKLFFLGSWVKGFVDGPQAGVFLKENGQLIPNPVP